MWTDSSFQLLELLRPRSATRVFSNILTRNICANGTPISVIFLKLKKPKESTLNNAQYSFQQNATQQQEKSTNADLATLIAQQISTSQITWSFIGQVNHILPILSVWRFPATARSSVQHVDTSKSAARSFSRASNMLTTTLQFFKWFK